MADSGAGTHADEPIDLPIDPWNGQESDEQHGGQGDGGRGRIVVGLSGSLGSLAALHRAVAEARRLDAEVLAVHCWTPVGGEFGYRRSPCPPLLTACRDAAAARLREALDQAFGGTPAGVRLRGVAVRGETGQALVRCADRPGDLLVLGAGSRGALARALRPSVTAYCVRHAACPVLAVPKPPLQRELEALRRHHRVRMPVTA
ncbi:universal stress protein [Streptomyces sp. BE303]|uniref:universal stress protein n=1 Tax=Streptomyces sp. BE303 TaxID=3002528 RepID=UPI002E76A4B2|nr:universal stress protein [Streptomyces sp. BE303]MED7947333.1 universal stress protein [Streptomyces sp. BE303]